MYEFQGSCTVKMVIAKCICIKKRELITFLYPQKDAEVLHCKKRLPQSADLEVPGLVKQCMHIHDVIHYFRIQALTYRSGLQGQNYVYVVSQMVKIYASAISSRDCRA